MSAKESFLNLANSVEKGEVDVINKGPTNFDSEGNMQITFDFKDNRPIIKQEGEFQTKNLDRALVFQGDSEKEYCGKIIKHKSTQIAIWDKYGNNLYPGMRKHDLDMKKGLVNS